MPVPHSEQFPEPSHLSHLDTPIPILEPLHSVKTAATGPFVLHTMSDQGDVYYAMYDEKPVGQVRAYIETRLNIPTRSVYITSAEVTDPDARGQGIGTNLLRTMLFQMVNYGARTIWAERVPTLGVQLAMRYAKFDVMTVYDPDHEAALPITREQMIGSMARCEAREQERMKLDTHILSQEDLYSSWRLCFDATDRDFLAQLKYHVPRSVHGDVEAAIVQGRHYPRGWDGSYPAIVQNVNSVGLEKDAE